MKKRIEIAIVHQAILAASIMLSATASAQVSIHPRGDVFDAPPPAATTRGKRACEPAQRYVDLIAARTLRPTRDTVRRRRGVCHAYRDGAARADRNR